MRFALAIVAFALSSAGVHASSRMPVAEITSQPIGHYEFCQQRPSECDVVSLTDAPTYLTKSRWSELVAVNTSINAQIEPVTDQDQYGIEEFWTYPEHQGDCEDYVLVKRDTLMRMGWPASSLLITVVRKEDGEGHAVLTVRTSNGDFVLDNIVNEIRRWDKTPYHFVKRQSARHSGRWQTVGLPSYVVATRSLNGDR